MEHSPVIMHSVLQVEDNILSTTIAQNSDEGEKQGQHFMGFEWTDCNLQKGSNP